MTALDSPRFRARLAAICKTLPGAEAPDPRGGGQKARKVGGTMLACIGARRPGIRVKTDRIETASLPIAAGIASRHGSSTAPGCICPRISRLTSWTTGRGCIRRRLRGLAPACVP